ncbi:MFS transporter [Flavobacterium gilvum]|uniref:MFS transporter n=1 Tax=Flavobacterium gilvum TaxID=1492737 RepID=A0AAC9I780_9FLAO|nr:MFS transporter [Flavobacterium gilvum]AOW10323.1 MFS transporter [Flavobacterium gilvum]KFC59787.1 major facilitator transporter [Flavobacterium gilvum]
MIKNYSDNFKGFSKEIWIITFITFLNRAGTMVIPFLSKYMKENLSFSYNQIGWIMFFFGVGSIIGSWLSGKLSDKIGFYKVMVFSLFTSGVIFIILQYLTSFESLCVGILILTSVADMYRPAMLLALDTYGNKETRTRALTLTRMAINMGFLIGPVLGGLIIMNIGYNGLFWIDGSTCILAILIFILLIKEKKLPFKVKKVKSETKANKVIFGDRPFILHLIITMITGILFFQMFTTLPLYYKQQFNFTEFETGLILSFSGLITILFELPIVRFVEERNIDRIKVISLGILSMSISLLLLLIDNWSGVIILMICFMSIGIMLTLPFANSFAMSRVHMNLKGRYIAIFTMSYSFAHILSAKTSMAIIETFSYRANWLFMGTLGTIALILCYCLSIILKKERQNIELKIKESLFS